MIKCIKNISGSEKTWRGYVLSNNAVLTIEPSEWFQWTSDLSVAAAISNDEAVLTDGTNTLSKEDSYAYLQEVPGRNLVDHQNKIFVHQSSRPIGTDTFYTGVDDYGVNLEVNHIIGQQDVSVYADFNVIDNITYVHEAMVQWVNAQMDHVSAQVVPKLTTYTSGTNTNFNIHPSTGFIIPTAGDGVITPSTINLVDFGRDQDTGLPHALQFWNCDIVNGAFDLNTLAAAPNGDGQYNMCTVEFSMAEFVRHIPMLGTTSAWNILPSSDTASLNIGNRLKMIFETRGADHNWQAAIALVMHREKL